MLKRIGMQLRIMLVAMLSVILLVSQVSMGFASTKETSVTGKASMVYQDDKNIDKDKTVVTPKGTVYGDAGYSWINTSYVSAKKAQAAFGCHTYYSKMAAVHWVVSWGDGLTNSGVAFPVSYDWQSSKTHTYGSSGGYTTMLSGWALLSNGTNAIIGDPVSYVSV